MAQRTRNTAPDGAPPEAAREPETPPFKPATNGYTPDPLATAPAFLTEQRKLIYWQMNRAMKAFARVGLGKTRENREQHFKFRGIDELLNLGAPILVEHGIVVLPEVTSRTLTERETARGTLMFNVALGVSFTFVSALDGSSHIVKTAGEASDTGDKATNKAMSAAFKYALLQAFAIPLEGEGEDADASTPDETVRSRKSDKPAPPEGYGPEFLTRATNAARGGTDDMRKAWVESKNGERARWDYLVKHDDENWKIIKGHAADIDAKVRDIKERR